MTAEQILNEIDDARANVRSVTLRTLKELSHRPASQKKQRRGSAKRPSPVFEDDEVEALMPPASPPDVADVALRELANSPRSQRPASSMLGCSRNTMGCRRRRGSRRSGSARSTGVGTTRATRR